MAAEPADDLTRISGIGPRLQASLNADGITRLAQIARLTVKQAAALDARLGLRGRVARQGWIEQARALTQAQERPQARTTASDKPAAASGD